MRMLSRVLGLDIILNIWKIHFFLLTGIVNCIAKKLVTVQILFRWFVTFCLGVNTSNSACFFSIFRYMCCSATSKMRFWYRYKVWVVPGLNCQRTHLFARDTLLYILVICSKYKLQRLAPCVIILIASINHQLASSPLSSLQLDSDATQGNNGQKTIFQTSHLVSKPYLRPIFLRLFKEWEKVFGAAVAADCATVERSHVAGFVPILHT